MKRVESTTSHRILHVTATGAVLALGPYSGLFGYREGPRKFIYDGVGDVAELYDPRTDPDERMNLVSRSPAVARAGRARLAAWVQYQNRFFADLLAPEAR